MNTQNNTAATENNAAEGEARQEWPHRYGDMTRLQIKRGRKGEYGIVTVDCGKFFQTAFVFNEKALAVLKGAMKKARAANMDAKVWIKGPIEAVEKDGIEEDQMKVVYASDKTKYEGEAQTDDAPEAEVEDLTSIKGIGEQVAAELADAGVTTYAQLAAMTDDELVAVKDTFVKRDERYGWRAQAAEKAAAMAAKDEAAKSAPSTADLDEEIPF